MPSISLGNIYRNIGILREESRIQTRDVGDGVEHYDAITDRHYHFICEKCGKIADFNLLIPHNIVKFAQKQTRNRIETHTINFYGICDKCKSEKE